MIFQKNPKKILVLLTFLILAIGIIIGGFLVLKSKIDQSGAPSKNISLNSLKDSDEDGLLDWEEAIYKTNPNNPDTDGDGYFDGEEIASGYDPLKPAPNDKSSDKAMEPRPAPGVLSRDTNLTKVLVQDIVSGMMAGAINPLVSENGAADIDSASQANLDEFLTNALADSSQVLIPEIKDEELKISSDNSEEAVKNYLTKYSEIILKYLDAPEFKTTEMEDTLHALETRNFSQINKRINAYKLTYEELKNTPVPLNALEIHKLELQILLISINTFEAVKNVDEDPLKAVLAVQNHPITIDLAKEIAIKADELVKKIVESQS
ncbi:MAG: hypothetical protein A3A94_01460 [Candidatus Portnoybacteria bacterium RIFCSPLOWO2_01_FULL_43_11]|uniref:EF-hand domain-containing protein n=3 Tax=Candidatus Portnoyibacteriota TaxID=1817913 RepID=A0A1G2FB15_9BACT|nr:MAG: hypothetical protein A2815_02785 [Candidatus Portnoybacteria bacterium RIFCSPHIGHO2_01_FULL_40_12b]OGZ37243.1 MAG: hypothetical protein A3D38_01775 [Candidatus Portnoybacteria bacterium RIFCSPHIGHO2_02_FULL_40_23]OGZ37999.1 MAG: hypothetical protein A3A94_01460 [Candidatus Portnoybacteria bacterium RIFCSPLOWO2_01_FULL_43_11]OGZ40909.1 MAG: hypothetical protein A3I20_01685 [Candidatus Portnoybacteria bacterium RIFCSPLOWO2_02_FULL_40_15]